MKKLYIVLILAFVLRVLLVPVAHHGDLNNNISWGQLLVERGPAEFYGSSDANDWPYSAPNQPPLTLLTFGLTSLVYNLVGSTTTYLNQHIDLFPSTFVWYWEINGLDLIVKLPGILADVGIGGVIYAFVYRQTKKQKQALLLAVVWLINPVTWYNSAIWGQTDPVVNLLGLFAVFALLDRKFVKFALIFTLSLLFKGSLAIFVPVLAVVALKQRYSWLEWLKAAGVSVSALLIVSYWFHPRLDFPIWLVQLYTNRILPGEIGYLTANAFNFWWLVNPGKVLDSATFFGLTARVWSLVVVGLVYFYVLHRLWKAKATTKSVLSALMLASLITFIFLTRIHERYLYPFFPYATLGLIITPVLWLPYVVLSVVHLLNMYHLFWAPGVPWLEHLYTNQFFPIALSMLMVLYSMYIYIRTLSRHGGGGTGYN